MPRGFSFPFEEWLANRAGVVFTISGLTLFAVLIIGVGYSIISGWKKERKSKNHTESNIGRF